MDKKDLGRFFRSIGEDLSRMLDANGGEAVKTIWKDRDIIIGRDIFGKVHVLVRPLREGDKPGKCRAMAHRN